MAQIKTGQAIVTNNSATVTGSGTDWISKAKVGSVFKIQGELVDYTVAAVSASLQQLTLTETYKGSSGTKDYVIQTDFTSALGLAEISAGDVDWPHLHTRSMRKLDQLQALAASGMTYQGSWNATTDSPALPAAGAGNTGEYYIVSSAGTYGGTAYSIGDRIASNGSAWQKFIGAEKGDQGPQGEQGATGPAGAAGSNGVNGSNGATGPQGPQGIKGDQGDQGEPGLPGITTLSATSTTSITIPTVLPASKTLAIQTGKEYIKGMTVMIASDAAPSTNYMSGKVTSYSGSTLVVDVDTVNGSGTHADWSISYASSSLRLGTTATTAAKGDTVVIANQDPGTLGSHQIWVNPSSVPLTQTHATDADAHHNQQHLITDVSHHTFPGGTTEFLRADGTFAEPTSGGTPHGNDNELQYNTSGAFDSSSQFTVDPTAGTLKVVYDGDINSGFVAEHFAENTSNGVFAIYRAEGTPLAKTHIHTGEPLGSFAFYGYGTTDYGFSAASITCSAAQDFTDTAKGTNLLFRVTPTNTTTKINALIVNNDGTIEIPTSGKGLKFPTGKILTIGSDGIPEVDGVDIATGGGNLTLQWLHMDGDFPATAANNYFYYGYIGGLSDSISLPDSTTGRIVFALAASVTDTLTITGNIHGSASYTITGGEIIEFTANWATATAWVMTYRGPIDAIMSDTLNRGNQKVYLADSTGTNAAVWDATNKSLGVGADPIQPGSAWNGSNLQVINTTNASLGANLWDGPASMRRGDNTHQALIVGAKARGDIGSALSTIVTGDPIVDFAAYAYEGTNWRRSGMLRFISTGTIGTNQVPCNAVLYNSNTSGTLTAAFTAAADGSYNMQVDAVAAPASASATGTKGTVIIRNDYIYVCTATNTWKRTALATW